MDKEPNDALAHTLLLRDLVVFFFASACLFFLAAALKKKTLF